MFSFLKRREHLIPARNKQIKESDECDGKEGDDTRGVG
jgi:hypothetical protein